MGGRGTSSGGGRAGGGAGARGAKSTANEFQKPASAALTDALWNGKVSKITSWVKEQPDGTQIKLRVSGITRVYTKEPAKGKSAAFWSQDGSSKKYTSSALASNILTGSRSWNTIDQFYTNAFQVKGASEKK